MNRALKWILIGGGGLLLVLIAAIILIPLLVDVNRYKPQIEAKVQQATGRSFAIGGDIDLSVFPWIGVSLSDLSLGSPAGFEETHLLKVGDFEARVKLMPLLSRQVEIKRVVLQAPQITLVKKKSGQTNWDFKPPETATQPEATPKETKDEDSGLALQSLTAEEIAIRDGTVIYLDQAAGSRHEISELNLALADVSLDQPLSLTFSTRLNGQPLEVKGTLGPIGSPPASQPVSYDLTIAALDELQANVKGSARNLTEQPAFEMTLEVAAFSPRKLFERLGQPFPIQTADPAVLNEVALKARINGSTTQASLEEGTLVLDDSQTDFSLAAKDFKKPDIAFDVRMDAIDADRYLPAPAESSGGAPSPPKGGQAEEAPKPPPDYGPLRKLVLDGRLSIGQLKVAKARMQNVRFQVAGREGRFRIEPMASELYGGAATLTGTIDVRQKTPQSDLQLQLENIAAGPMLRDVAQKNIIEGRLVSDMRLQFQGDDPQRIKQTLNGGGQLSFLDGAIVGIDLAAMVRNVQAAFSEGAVTAAEGAPQTEFTEFVVPFGLRNGTFATEDTRLKSPVLGIQAQGQANLVAEQLAFRVVPEYVATHKGQRTSDDLKEIKVPVLISGSFENPQFAPDLKAVAKQQLQKEIIDSGKLDEVFEKNEDLKPLEDTAKGVLKKLFE
jgi:AsmA protein